MDDFDPQICDLCWETFPSPDALSEHVEAENSHPYHFDMADER